LASNPPIEIKRPRPGDGAAIATFGRQTFAETFVGVAYYTQEIIDGYSDKAFAPAVIEAELRNPRIHYLLLQVGDELAGYAKLVEKEPTQHLGAFPDSIYLERIYVAKAFHHGGHGTRLLNAVYDVARDLGYKRMWLSVWEFNQKAYAFYDKHGFSKAGEWDWPFESHGVKYVDTDWLMTRDIPPK
jgi:ribosomal protein S18 acetylase RimI-like enzyme